MNSEHDWLDELEFPQGPPWLRMGVSRIEPSAWLMAPDSDQLEQRAELIESRREEVLSITEPGVPAVEELAVAVASHLALDDDAFVWDPLAQIGVTVCEDLCVLTEWRGDLRLTAALVCFPSHWRLAEKMGRTLVEIHEPVPDYAAELSPRVDTFLTRLGPDGVFARRNWSIQWNEELFAPWPRGERAQGRPTIGDGDVGSMAFVRSERQTLRRLPETGAVVFTIRTQQAPLAALRRRPEVNRRLEEWMEAAPAELVRARCGRY